MNIHADKTDKDSSQSVANNFSQKRTGSGSASRFVDNRPEVIAQRKLQETANHSLRVKQLMAVRSPTGNVSTQPHKEGNPKPVRKGALEEVVQAKKLEKNRLNVVGENHKESGERRVIEQRLAAREAGGGYWQEHQFMIHPLGEEEPGMQGDPHIYKIFHRIKTIEELFPAFITILQQSKVAITSTDPFDVKYEKAYKPIFNALSESLRLTNNSISQILIGIECLEGDREEEKSYWPEEYHKVIDTLKKVCPQVNDLSGKVIDIREAMVADRENEGLWIELVKAIQALVIPLVHLVKANSGHIEGIMEKRNTTMKTAARFGAGTRGVWKIGGDHLGGMNFIAANDQYNLLTRDDFYLDQDYIDELMPMEYWDQKVTEYRNDPRTKARDQQLTDRGYHI